MLLYDRLGVRRSATWLRCVAALGVLVTPKANGQGLRPPWSMNGSAAPGMRPTRFGAACDSVVPPAEGTPADSTYQPASSTAMVLPNLHDLPESMQGQTITTRFFVSASGGVDSVGFLGRLDRRYAGILKAGARQWHFRPAIYRGCAVKSSYQITTTFGRGSAPSMEPVPVEYVGRDWPVMMQLPWTAPDFPLDQYALPGELTACSARHPSLSYGELPDPRAAHGDGSVVLRFVIDSMGAPVDSTVRIVRTSGPAFTAVVRRAFPSLRFQPAWCSGGPVAMDVQYTFVFAK
jgi:hypothetical protein